IGKVIKQARQIVPLDIPLHLYGGGDPLELPFYIALGCDIFDSSSFIHYAHAGWYMTPFGALKGRRALDVDEYLCSCPYCKNEDQVLWSNETLLASHNLWVILDVLEKVRRCMKEGTLSTYLNYVAAVHQSWFPESRLGESWNLLREGTLLDK
ncbi:MAG TPA: tRNA-guanine transglycosylase, partial [Ktedonobacteraceae bacterium]